VGRRARHLSSVNPQPILPTNDLTAGSEVGPYRLLRPLGSGGMAQVFLAVHRHLGHVRAVKVLLPEASEARAALALRLITEARAMTRLRHPAIAEVFDCDTLPSAGAFIAMEYLEGEPLGRWLERIGSLERHPALAAALVGTIADALAYAHQHGIVHRDLKPDNFFLVPDPTARGRLSVKVLDFGIAKILGEKPLVTTRTGCIVGTPVYMAPEGWEAGSEVDQRTDIYSLGCVAFELLCGRTPFVAEDTLQLMRAHLMDTPPRITALASAVPAPLADLVAHMLEKRPEDRPQTMEEVIVALESALGCERAHFAERLVAPSELAMATTGSASRVEPTALGVGVLAHVIVSNTTEVAPPRMRASFSRRASARLALAAACAAVAVLVAAVVAGVVTVKLGEGRGGNRSAGPTSSFSASPRGEEAGPEARPLSAPSAGGGTEGAGRSGEMAPPAVIQPILLPAPPPRPKPTRHQRRTGQVHRPVGD